MEELNEDSLGAYVSRPGVAFVLFGASDCRPSRNQEAEFRAIIGKDAEPVRFGRIDALLNDCAARSADVRRLPTTLVFQDGVRREALEGFRTRYQIEALLRRMAGECAGV